MIDLRNCLIDYKPKHKPSILPLVVMIGAIVLMTIATAGYMAVRSKPTARQNCGSCHSVKSAAAEYVKKTGMMTHKKWKALFTLQNEYVRKQKILAELEKTL